MRRARLQLRQWRLLRCRLRLQLQLRLLGGWLRLWLWLWDELGLWVGVWLGHRLRLGRGLGRRLGLGSWRHRFRSRRRRRSSLNRGRYGRRHRRRRGWQARVAVRQRLPFGRDGREHVESALQLGGELLRPQVGVPLGARLLRRQRPGGVPRGIEDDGARVECLRHLGRIQGCPAIAGVGQHVGLIGALGA